MVERCTQLLWAIANAFLFAIVCPIGLGVTLYLMGLPLDPLLIFLSGFGSGVVFGLLLISPWIVGNNSTSNPHSKFAQQSSYENASAQPVVFESATREIEATPEVVCILRRDPLLPHSYCSFVVFRWVGYPEYLWYRDSDNDSWCYTSDLASAAKFDAYSHAWTVAHRLWCIGCDCEYEFSIAYMDRACLIAS